MKHTQNTPQLAKLRAQARAWRQKFAATNDERAKLNQLIIECMDIGHSFSEIREATGLGTATIQMTLAKAGRLPENDDERAKLIIEAREAGQSFAEIREFTGLGVSTIQLVLARAGKL